MEEKFDYEGGGSLSKDLKGSIEMESKYEDQVESKFDSTTNLGSDESHLYGTYTAEDYAEDANEKHEPDSTMKKTGTRKSGRRRKKRNSSRSASSRSTRSNTEAPSDMISTELVDHDAETKKFMLNKSQKLMLQRHEERERVKRELMERRAAYRTHMQQTRLQKQRDWTSKLEKSPFLVNLIAETERIEEEQRIRKHDDHRRRQTLDKRRNKVKNGIILKALQEASDLEALRAEKRLIIEEERKLKAMIELEKTNLNRKQDLMAAIRAEKQRRQMQLEFRRQKRTQAEKEKRAQSRFALMEKLGLEDDTEDTA